MTIDTDTIIYQGGAVKALGEGKVGGYLVLFSTASDPDLVGDFFTPDTDFGSHKSTPVLYQHGLDRTIKRRRLGTADLRTDDVGVWVEAQLALRDDYEREIYEMAQAGKLGWSSGTAAHLVERETSGKAQRLLAWPLGLDASLTPTPAEPRTRSVALKSITIGNFYAPPGSHTHSITFDEVLPDPEVDGAEAARKAAVAPTEDGHDKRKLLLELDIMELDYENSQRAA
jgi:phage head maturation protease